MKNLVLVLGGLAVSGCASIVDDPCADGYQLVDGSCQIVSGFGDDDVGSGSNGGGDSSGGGTGDDNNNGGGGIQPPGSQPPGTVQPVDPEPLVCELPEKLCDGACIDVMSDPDNCGACDRVCGSGICAQGHCEGELSGHIVAIGHDYQQHHAAMARVLGNSAALAPGTTIDIARLRGSATIAASNGTTLALHKSLAAIGRAWSTVALPATPSIPSHVEVLLVEAQTGDAAAAHATGAAWAAPIDSFLLRGGVVIVLEGHAGTSYQFAKGANLYDVAAPVSSFHQHAIVVDTSDAVTQNVLSPYAAETSSVTFADVADPVITTADGAPLVFHITR